MRILIVEVNWLGDVLFSTPAIRALRKKFPESFISCLIVPRVKEILEGNPNINELIINEEGAGHRGFSGKIRLANELRKKKFDTAIFFHRSFSRAAVAYFAGISNRLGYSTWKRRFLLTNPLPMPQKDSLHRVDYYLNIVGALGCDTADRFYELFISEDDDAFIEDFLMRENVSKKDFVVCLNPGGNWLPKRWPKESFAQLAQRLISDYKAKVIFSGAREDVPLIREIAGLMKYRPIIAAGITNLKQSASIFKKADLVVSADSGPLHIAAAVGANIIALFGPTAHLTTGPIGKGKIKIIQKTIDCRLPCYDKNCDDNLCMREITVDEVLAEVPLII